MAAGLIPSLIGTLQGNSAYNNAANAIEGGYNSAGQTVTAASNTANTGIGNAVTQGQTVATNAAATAGQNATDAASYAGGQAIQAGQNAANALTASGQNAGLAALYAAGNANQLLQPYSDNGAQASNSLAAFMAPGGRGATPFTADYMQQYDPGYKFALDQGMSAINRSAAAGGQTVGGGTLKALTSYATGAAQQGYHQAFEDYTQQNQNTFNNLNTVANAGQAASGQMGANLQNSAQYYGNTGLTAAQGAGQFNTQATQYSGNLAANAAQYSGNLATNAAQYSGTLGLQGAGMQSDNLMNTGRYVGNTQIGSAEAKAANFLGHANNWNSLLSGISGSLNTYGALLSGNNPAGAGKKP